MVIDYRREGYQVSADANVVTIVTVEKRRWVKMKARLFIVVTSQYGSSQ